MDDTKRGLFGKYSVKRLDGSSEPGGKHGKCMYYVLDLDHDKHSKAAIRAYAKSCKKEYPELAKDLLELLKKPERDCGCRSASHECGRFFAPAVRPLFGKGNL